MIFRSLPTGGLILLASFSVFADEPLRPLRVVRPPVIDGDLSDGVWSQAPSVSGFVTFIPDFGKPQEQKTIVSMAYDAENIYFAFRCYDDPALVKTSVAARDQIRPDDWVCINLDTFGDHQGLYALYVNPHGIQSDSRFAGGSEDFSADLVWYSAGMVTDDGYQVEIQIPLQSIRYANTDTVVMKVFFERHISRTSEHGSYPELDPNKGYAFLTQMAPIEFVGLRHFTLFEILPAVVFNEQREHRDGSFGVSDVRREASLTAKYGITSDLILDGTYNPDFSQVEADAGQVDVNLRTNLFFAEKRPFFLEGREYFAIAGTGGPSPVRQLVHTRTIVDPVVGVKVSGKAGASNVLSAVYADDDVQGASSNAQFFVLRYRRILDDDSFIGAIVTDREFGSAFNRVGGVDAKVRVGENALVEGHAVGSMTRPAAGTARDNGHSVSASYALSDRDRSYGAAFVDVGENFKTDVGYMIRNGLTTARVYYEPTLYFEHPFFNRLGYGFYADMTLDKPSDLWETSTSAVLTLLHRGNLYLQTNFTYSTEVFLGRRFSTSHVSMVWGGQVTKWLGVTLNASSGNSIYYSATPFAGSSNTLYSRLTFQPLENVSVDYSLTYARFRGDTTSAFDYSYPINRLKFTYQVNQYLFVRAITEYNGFRRRLPTDLLVSFTYIPGTVIHAGYGTIHQRRAWDPPTSSYIPADNLLRMNSGLFFKASYLWRL